MLEFEQSAMTMVVNWIAQNAPIFVAGIVFGVIMSAI